jgi:hypothetical protein
MAKKQTSTPSRGNVAKASTSNARRRPERSVDMLTGSRDPAIIVNTLRDNWNGSLQHQRPLSMSRAYAELVKLLEGPRPDPAPYWGKLKFYADLLRTHFALPRVLKFFPRNSVPTGPQYKGYNEDPYQRTFSSPHAGESTAPGASGYGAFNPNTGFFQAVGVSTGNEVAVMVGPIVTIDTTAAVDALITTQALVDYQYTVSSSVNPAFISKPPYTGEGWVDLDIALLPRVTCLAKVTNALISPPSGPFGYRQLRSLTVDFDLQRTPFTTPSGHETRVGHSDHGSDVALSITFETEVQLPANAKCDISTVAYIKSDARGGKGETRWMSLGFGDVRASGQFLSMEVGLYS